MQKKHETLGEKFNQRYDLICKGADYDKLFVDPNGKQELNDDALTALDDWLYTEVKEISIHRQQRVTYELPKRIKAMLKAVKWNRSTKNGQWDVINDVSTLAFYFR